MKRFSQVGGGDGWGISLPAIHVSSTEPGQTAGFKCSVFHIATRTDPQDSQQGRSRCARAGARPPDFSGWHRGLDHEPSLGGHFRCWMEPGTGARPPGAGWR